MGVKLGLNNNTLDCYWTSTDINGYSGRMPGAVGLYLNSNTLYIYSSSTTHDKMKYQYARAFINY